MKDYLIYVDASSDLSPDYLHARDVQVLPMTCLSGTEMHTLTGYEDDLTLAGYYREMREGKMFSTSQITPGEYEEAFAPAMREGKDVLYLALSSGLTSTVESACLAAETLNREHAPAKMYVVDTLSATGGINLLAERAVHFRKEGIGAEKAAQLLTELARQVCHVFMVTDLMHLCRGGRISGASARVGTMLHVIPILIIDEQGKLEVVDKKRGEHSAIRELRKRFENSWNGQDYKMYSTHGNWPEEAVRLEKQLLEINPDVRIEKRIISPVIGAHTGPGMLSIIFFGDRQKIKED